MATILVTGGAGYVGAHCVKALAAAGHRPVVFDNLLYGHRDFVRWGELIVGDIRDGGQLDAVFARVRPDAVMHFAALAYVGQSVSDPSLYYDVNIGGTRVLLDAMRRAEVRRIVFSSSCAIYGEPPTAAITEDLPARPINPYGFSKHACERMMEDYGRAYGLRSARLRYFNAAGADPQANIGEHHDPETHLIPLVLDAALGRRARVTVFGQDYPTPDGTAVRDYVHVEDLGRAHLAALKRLLAGGEGCAVNLGSGRGGSVREIIKAAIEITGRPIQIENGPRRPGDPGSLVADPSAAAKLLNWRTESSDIRTILTDAWRWHLKAFSDRGQVN